MSEEDADKSHTLDESGDKSGDFSQDQLNDSDLNLNNNADEDGSLPTSPLPRSVSQLSQPSDAEGTAISRHSSPPNRPGSTKSALSRDSASGVSFVTVSGRKSRAKSSLAASEAAAPVTHQVTFTVTISAAVPAAVGPEQTITYEPQAKQNRRRSTSSSHVDSKSVYDDDGDKNKSKRVVSDPKPQAFYHMEYYLLPTDVDPNKTDITLFGIAAKIYPEKQDAKVMKTWTEGNKTWIAWAQSHVVNLTTEMLKKFCYHKVVVRIWDSRDKFGPKARFDRPRAFKFPPPKQGEDLDDISGVKTFIARMAKAYIRRLPKNAGERTLPQPQVNENKPKSKLVDTESTQNAGLPGVGPHPQTFNTDDVPCLLLGHPDMEYRIFSKLVELAKLEMQSLDRKMIRKNLDNFKKSPVADERPKSTENDKQSPTRTKTKGKRVKLPPVYNEQDPFGSQNKPGGKSASPVSRKKFPRDKKAEQLAKEAVDYAKKNGVCSVHVPVAPLFIAKDEGQRMCIARLTHPVKSVLDAFVSVSVDRELLTPQFTKELNPMSIKIKSVKHLPDEPVGYEQLKEKCHPATLSYSFLKHGPHITKGIPQDKHLYWDDINVVLVGTFPQSELTEYLLGPPMEIQVHDRDKIATQAQLNPALFGDDGEDEKISNVGYIAGRRTQYNALKDRPTSWDPYGVARVNMSEFLLGQKVINLQIPVHNCAVPDVLGRQTDSGRVMGMPGSVDGPSEPPMPPGSYMDSHTTMKIRLELAIPLTTPLTVAEKPYIPTTEQCPFGKIVYILDQRNRGIAKSLLSTISDINSRGLGLDNLSPVVLDAALSTYKLSAEQQVRRDLDIVTGFQLLDGRHHLFILEGLREKAIKHIWDTMCKPKEGVQVLYNSDLSFGKRLYGTLDVDLTRVKLHEPISLIVQQPLLFVRDMVPRSCFISLNKLDELMQCADMRSAARNDLFPTSDEVISMSREFGVPLTADDLITDAEKSAVNELEIKSRSAIPANATSRMSRSRMHLKDPLDMDNTQYLEALKSRQKTAEGINYQADNIRSVMLESRQNKLRKQYHPMQHSAQGTAQNYSISTYNSTELAKDIIRQNMDKDTLYTYNAAYHHSGTFVPVNVEEIKKQEKIAHRQKFVSKKDWVYPEVKNLRQCNEHPKKPDPARCDALTHEWQENLDHKNKLNPTLEERDTYSWIDRGLDLDTWSYPSKNPQPEPVHSIMLPGKKLKDEWIESKRNDHDLWQSKVVAKDPEMHFYRCNPQTEAIPRGPKASNELSKLENLLRDPPVKHSYAAPIMRTDIPPLRVVHYPSVDTKARDRGVNVDAVTSEMMKQAEKLQAYKPGPFERRSWSIENNRVPAINYNHADNGYFNLYHNMLHNQNIYKKQITPLNDGEYKTSYLFADPETADRGRQRHAVAASRSREMLTAPTASQTQLQPTAA